MQLLVFVESTQMGNYSRQFENKIASIFNKNYCLYVNSGSSALYVGVESFNFPAKSEVITLFDIFYHHWMLG